MGVAIVDTGPLVALCNRADRYHRWAVDQIEEIGSPLLVCEPVLTEALYLLFKYPKAHDALFDLLENGALEIAFRADEHVGTLRQLMQKYRDTPMSFADACIVRMAEIFDRHVVLTLDSDFTIYRKHGRVPLAVIRPEAS